MSETNENGGTINPVHIPEVMDDNDPRDKHTEITLSESGNFPALRTRLRDALGGFQARQTAAVEEIIKVAAAQTEFLEKVSRETKIQYTDMIHFHEKMGA